MARQRNFKEEYRRRIARAEARGLTRKQARGHGGDALKRSPPTVQSSPIYTTEKLAQGYISRLGSNRRAKLVAVFEDGSTVIAGKKGGMRPEELLDQDVLDVMHEKRQKYTRGQAGTGT